MHKRILVLLLWMSASLLYSMVSYASSHASFKVAIEADDVVSRVLFDAISDDLNVSIEYVTYPSFDEILSAVASKQADFAANVTYTDSRALLFDFSSPTNIEYTYLYSLNNATLSDVSVVGVPKDTIYGSLIRQHFPHIKQIEYSGHDHGKWLLGSGKVEGIVDAINQLKPMLMSGMDAQLLNHQLTIKPVSIVTAKGNHSDWLGQFERVVHSAYVQQHLRESIENYQFTIRQQALRSAVYNSGLNIKEPLKVKLENVGNFAMFNGDGSVTGISAEVLFEACQVLMLDCQLVNPATETWETMYASLIDKQIDVLTPITVTDHRKELVNFSEPYYEANAILVTREGYKTGVYRNVSELVTEQIGVVSGDIYDELLTSLLPKKTLLRYSNVDAQIAALLEGEVSYISLSEATFNRILRNASGDLPITKASSIASFYSAQIALGFPNTVKGEILSGLFSRAIKMIDVTKIIEQYDLAPNWQAALQAEKRYSRNNQMILLLVLGIVGVFAFYLHIQSNTDNLTSLKNRRSLHRKYGSGLGPELALIYIDVNHFKSINDSYGHEVGDDVLRLIAERIKSVWHGDSYRIGGDEFILVGKAKDKDIDKVKQSLGICRYYSGSKDLTFPVTSSIGLSARRHESMSLQAVLNCADQAMYKEKRASKMAAKTVEQEPLVGIHS